MAITTQTKAYAYTVLTILLWSTVATAFKIALREVDYVQLLFYASLASLLSLFVVLTLQGKLGLLARLSVGQVAYSALLGLINPTLYYLILFRAYDLLPAQEAQPLNWTWPIALTILSAVVLKQRLTVRTVMAILVSFSGVLVIATRGDLAALRLSNPPGDILAVGSSLFWAAFWVLNLRDRRDPVLKLFLCFLFGNIYNTIVVLLLADFTLPSLKGFAGAAYVGLFEMGITFVIWLKALSLSRDSASVGILAYLTPFLSLIFIRFVLGETILLSSFIGLVLIVGGILLQVGREVKAD